MPRHNVKWRMLLLALEELATQLVDDLPRLLLNLVFGYWMKKVPSVSQTVGAEGTQFRKFEV